MKVLVIANNVRSVVCSAKRAGYSVYALDRFGDVDMRRCADGSKLIESSEESKIHEQAASYGEVDAVILGPGFEHLKFKNVFNNPSEVVKEISDKSKLPEKLKKMGIPHPETESIDRAESLGFPLMVKPRFGAGGILNIVVKNEEELELFKEKSDASEFIAQEFLKGIPCSASIISNGDDAVVVALNEQLIGVPWLTRLPFAYCGNITPFETEYSDEMIYQSEQIAREFGLIGSNGVDFIVNEKGISVIEVNPRFQGSMDTVELSCGMNIFDAHIKSFAGELPEPWDPKCFAAKTIVFAVKEVVIGNKISDTLRKCMDKGEAADIPQPESLIHPDEPIATMLATARTSSSVLEKIRKTSRSIKIMSEA